MFPWFWSWAWSPHFDFPWSGSVAQRIEPITSLFFDSIRPGAGNGQIEKKAFEVASYGRQLGLISEVLIDLAKKAEGTGGLSTQAAASLRKLEEIDRQIEEIKVNEAESLARDVKERLRSLQKILEKKDKPQFAGLRDRFGPIFKAAGLL